MSNDRLIIAAAGSGKTTYIVKDSLLCEEDRVLITTFTEANESAIQGKYYKHYRCIPANVTIQTWFSFLIEHGVRPYQFWSEQVTGMELVTSRSGIKFVGKNGSVQWGEDENFFKHYFNSHMQVYSDKLSKLVIRCNEKSNGAVIKRLERIYSSLYVDEVQDMAGYDLELIKLLLGSQIKIMLVGDPRQVVYLTHHDQKNPKYNGKIQDFITEKCGKLNCAIDNATLNKSYRNPQTICDLSSKLYPALPVCESNKSEKAKDVLFFVNENDILDYCKEINPVQLRLNSKDVRIIPNYPVYNFGDSKGMEFPHILIFPTKDMLAWISNPETVLADTTRARFYVALTRAMLTAAIVVPNDYIETICGIYDWKSNNGDIYGGHCI